jgi:hypothetical protein
MNYMYVYMLLDVGTIYLAFVELYVIRCRLCVSFQKLYAYCFFLL